MDGIDDRPIDLAAEILRISLLRSEIPEAARSIVLQFFDRHDGFRPRMSATGKRSVSNALCCEALLDAAPLWRPSVTRIKNEWSPPYEENWSVHNPDSEEAQARRDDPLLEVYAASIVLPALSRCLGFTVGDASEYAAQASGTLEKLIAFSHTVETEPSDAEPQSHAMFTYHARRCLAFLHEQMWLEPLATYRKQSVDAVTEEIDQAIGRLRTFSIQKLQYILAMVGAAPASYDDQLQLAYLAALLDRYDHYENDTLIEHAILTALERLSANSEVPRVVPVYRTRNVQVACSTFEALVAMSRCRLIANNFSSARSAYEATLGWVLANKRDHPTKPTWLAEPWRGRDEPEAWVQCIILRFMTAYLRLAETSCQETIKQQLRADASEPKLKWQQILDQDGFKQTVEQRLLIPAKEDILAKRGLRRSGMVLFGPPGTAKTSIAHAIAWDVGWPLITVSPHDFAEDGLSGVIRRARVLFEKLTMLSGCVVLFDELDELVSERDDEYSKINRFITTSMLPFFQDLRDHASIIFIATTNYIDRFDSAIKRPGRFDLVLPVGPPDPDQYQGLISHQAGKRGLSGDALAAFADILAETIVAHRPPHRELGEPPPSASEAKEMANDGRWHATIGEVTEITDQVVEDLIAANIFNVSASEPLDFSGEPIRAQVTDFAKLRVMRAARHPLITTERFDEFRRDCEEHRHPQI